MTEKELLAAILAVVDACEGASGSIDDHLLVLETTWMERAQRARSDALCIPGRFQEVQAQQLDRLEQISALVRGDAPDLDLERLYLEGDFQGVADLLRRRLKGG